MTTMAASPVLALEYAGYVITGWLLTGAALGGYWLWIAQRTKRALKSQESTRSQEGQ